jgi:hypothetical protein
VLAVKVAAVPAVAVALPCSLLQLPVLLVVIPQRSASVLACSCLFFVAVACFIGCHPAGICFLSLLVLCCSCLFYWLSSRRDLLLSLLVLSISSNHSVTAP